MSACNESDKGEWVYNHVYTLIKEIAKGPKSYKQYSQDIVEKVLNELDKGGISIKVDFDDPVTGAYYTIVQSNSIDAEAKAVSRILMDFDELSEAGFKVDGNQQIFLYRLYELSCNKQLDVKSISTSDFTKLTKYADWIGKLGTVADAVEWAGYAGNILSAWVDGDTKKMADEVANIIGNSACGFISGQIATALISAFAVTNPLVAFATFAVLGLLGSAIGDEIAEGWKMIFDEIFGLYDDAGAYTYPVDPLIFDLNGDGVKTVALADGVHFDFDKNGFAEKIGWVSPEDGLLVSDLDKNGRIDNGGELFGDLTAIADGVNAVNGFEALKAFDMNEDGIIDSNDEIYAELKIWQDKNQNGVVDEGELLSLQEAGIAGIGLNYDTMNETDGQGNVHTQKGYYIKEDGSTALVEDVWFDRDLSDTVATEHLEETDEIQKLPDLQGRGNQYSLHQAMLRDKTGSLQKLVEQYVKEENFDSRKEMLTQIIYVWTGVMDYDPAGRGPNLSDARKLAALEVITGRDFNSNYGKDPVYQAGQYIEQAFDKLVELYFAQLESQTTYADLYVKLYQEMDIDESGNIVLGTDGIMEHFKELYPLESIEGKRNVIHFVHNMKNTGVLQMVDREKFYSELSVFGGDIEHAVEYIGNDVLIGTNGNDVLVGEMGNDTLQGGYGNDTYIFRLGDGEDTIREDGGTDKIIFGEGIREEDIRVSRDQWNLYLTNKESGDRITVQNFFNDTRYFVEEVRFADGSIWSINDIKEKANYYYGTEGDDTISAYNSYYYAPVSENDYLYGGAGNDTLNGNNGDDELYGGSGDDTLYGGNGNDVLNGGTGNDTLYGGSGDDTYIFQIGDGADTIREDGGNDKLVFGEGIACSDLMFARSGNDLQISLAGQEDKITISDYYNYYGNGRVESFHTSDGSTIDYTKLNLMIQAMASFEETTGMMWEDAIEQKNEQANDIVNQWWTKEAI